MSLTTAPASAFTVTVGGVAVAVSSVVVNGSTVELTLASAVGQGQAVTVAYADPTAGNDIGAVQDLAGNDTASLATTTVANVSAADLVAPVFRSALTSSDGRKVILTYSETLSTTTAPASAFTVKVGGVVVAVNSVAVNGNTVELTLANAIGQGQTVTVAYADPTAGNDLNAVQDQAGNDTATLAASTVANVSTTDITAPLFKGAMMSPDGSKVVLTYNAN